MSNMPEKGINKTLRLKYLHVIIFLFESTEIIVI